MWQSRTPAKLPCKVILIFIVESFPGSKLCNDRFQLCRIFVLLLDAFEIFFELCGVKDASHQDSGSSKSSLTLLTSCKFLPASASSIAWRVSAFGMETAKGRPLRKFTCLKKRVIAWLVERPNLSNTSSVSLLSFGSTLAVIWTVLGIVNIS